jgi:hypothetical protein
MNRTSIFTVVMLCCCGLAVQAGEVGQGSTTATKAAPIMITGILDHFIENVVLENSLPVR